MRLLLLLALGGSLVAPAGAWTPRPTAVRRSLPPLATSLAHDQDQTAVASSQDVLLRTMAALRQEAVDYAAMFGLSDAEAAFYAIFRGLRQVPLGLHGAPCLLRDAQLRESLQQETAWKGFFTMDDLEKATSEDFLDAARGSTDNRKGWKITDVSVPRGESFEEARMTYEDVCAALDKGTVIFNAAGAHIPKLAAPSLACTDATALPCALNLYVTAAGKRTSAPPHTDKQDVVVIQSTGRKHWKVYSPPDTRRKPQADMFSRGKGEDSLPLYALETEDFGCQLLLETTLNPGDVLFIPAAFPHTTNTVVDDDTAEADTSIHMTMGIDHHIWELDYLSARRLALRRACVKDTALDKAQDGENHFTGKCNLVDEAVRKDLFAELPLGFLDPDEEVSPGLMDTIISELERISTTVDAETASAVPKEVWKDTVERLRQQGVDLVETHRDMYLAAIEEGRTREAEDAMTAHLDDSNARRVMTPERMQRLSLFRVKRYYDQINGSKDSLKEWSFAGTATKASGSAPAAALPSNWAFTLPVKRGAQVEADLGGAFFAATVTRASGGTYDVHFFDGDQETNLDRSQIKLLAPPAQISDGDVDTSAMTPKQLKRWKKQQDKLTS